MDTWPFVGRDGELAAIEGAFAGSDVDAVVVAGPAGVGKTALAREALRRLRGTGCRAEWAAGTRAAASIPFGAVAQLVPPEWRPAGGPLGVLRAVAGHVGGWGGRRRVALGVDDAHLLDDSSAALVAHLVAGRLAFAVLTLRTGEQVPDAVTALWKEERAERLDLAGLPAEDVDRLLDRALPGRVDGLTRRRMAEAAAGNPLALRELVHGGLSGGALRTRYGVWRLDPGFQPRTRVTELVAQHLVGLDPATRLVVELVAEGEPVPLPALERLADAAAVRAAEDSGLVFVCRSGARVEARLAHPLYGEVLRAGLPLTRARMVRRRLAGALLATPMRRRGDALRAAQWQVDGGEVVRPDVVRVGARQAIGWSDLALAERLARAARDAEPGTEADVLLAEILEYRGKSAEAIALLADEPPPGTPDPVMWAVTRAETLYWGLGSAAAAERVLAGRGDLADGTLSWILMFDGRCVEALDAAGRVLAQREAHPQGVIWAAAGGTAAAGFLGRLAESAAIRDRGLPVAYAHQAPMPWGVYEIEIADCLANLAAGDLLRAGAVADRGYRQAVEAGVPMMVSGWALFGGLVAAARGHLDAAGALLREAVTGFEENDTFRFRRHCAAALAAVCALAGEPDEAATWLSEVDGAGTGPNRVFRPWLELSRAWVAMSRGAQADAVEAARHAADLAGEAGLPSVEAAALYDVARLGGRVDRKRLDALAARLSTPFAEALALAGQGLARADGTPLARAADLFEGLGQDLLAAEAGAAAARLFRRAGRRGQAHLVRGRSAAPRARCATARTPLLVNDEVAELLTAREREVVLMAAHHSSRHIAERLGLEVKTVNNHLARAYAKLGISSRAEVRALLGH
ncbi:AAA family ATPase [Phytohabitans houttuyneae]|uniref:LuxR family transcriptional regulator n=1 Tax=Phytohabitans houttuyneae TaxID=1076126 RepID=A0A6V8K1E1_9ACTN|nr:LuxR family transcriptional regulator [Phytohabitans houttuyneae]GFJ75979.1 LuxR family transcriptional regulator [Phytohabitans houttuyneae]